MFDITQLKKKLLPELQKISEDLQVENYKKYKKIDLIYQILDKQSLLDNDSPKKNNTNKKYTDKKKPFFNKNKNGSLDKNDEKRERKRHNPQGHFKRKNMILKELFQAREF